MTSWSWWHLVLLQGVVLGAFGGGGLVVCTNVVLFGNVNISRSWTALVNTTARVKKRHVHIQPRAIHWLKVRGSECESGPMYTKISLHKRLPKLYIATYVGI